MSDSIVEYTDVLSDLDSSTPRPSGRGREPLELCVWLKVHQEKLAHRWAAEIVARGPRVGGHRPLVEEFTSLLTSILPGCLGPHREHVVPLWLEAAELYGSVGARRGLAAGEVLEEFQQLREAVMRLLYLDLDSEGGGELPLREALRISRIIDTGVTQSSIGHTDALFFSLFQGTGVPPALTPALVEEVREQMTALREELRELS